MNKVIILITFTVYSATVAMTEEAIVANCPLKLTKQEKKIIAENRENFIKTLNKHVDIKGGDPAKPYDLRCANLKNIDLSNRMFQYIDFRHTNLDESDISNSKFEFVDLSGTSLKKVKANRAQFWDVTLDGAKFNNAYLPTISFIGTKKPIPAKKANFSEADISGSAQFSNIDIADANFDRVDFSNGGFEYIIMNKNTSFNNANFALAKFSNCRGYPGNLRDFLLKQKANLTNAYINGLSTNIPAS